MFCNPDYGSVATSENDGDAKANNTSWFWRFLKGGELDADEKTALRERLSDPTLKTVQNVETVLIHAESMRQISYALFWFKIICAFLFTTFMVDPETIANSDLKAMFGYNNICVLFDYSPSREYTAMVYPLFEYTFFLYVVFDYIHLRLVCKGSPKLEGLVTLSNILMPVKFLLIAWFRMIFVYNVKQAFVDFGVRGVVGHTMAFFGFQLALIMVSFENILFIMKTNVVYPRLGPYWTKFCCVLYLCLFISNTLFQMWFAFGIFWGFDTLNVHGDNPNPMHQLMITLVDRMWMILVGMLPLWFAQVGRKTQAHIRVTFELNTEAWEDDIHVTEGTVFIRNASIPA